MSFLLRTVRIAPRSVPQIRQFTSSRVLALKVDSNFVSQITAAEKKLTNSDEPIKGGPTAQAQSHVGQELDAQVIHDITVGEKVITNSDEPVKGGPTSIAQSIFTSSNSSASSGQGKGNDSESSGVLDSNTISKINEAEKKLSDRDGPIPDGPTAKAQQHSGEPITSQSLHDITEGEKKITGGQRVKGGPTSTAQSELGKSRS